MSTRMSRQNRLKEIIDDDKIFKGNDIHSLSEGRKLLFYGADEGELIDIDILITIEDFITYTSNVYYECSREDEFDINSYNYIVFKNFKFSKQLQINNSLRIDVKFENCSFNISPFIYGSAYEIKIKFDNCEFNTLTNNNVDFKEYVEFFNCRFINHTVFLKCYFYKNISFTKSVFLHNTFFTHSSFEKQLIFTRTKFGNKERPVGLDLSQSIINGTISFFMVELYSYPSISINIYSDTYDNVLKHGSYIPIENKRETFRIIKNQLIGQNNLIEAEKYLKFEKQTFLEEKHLEVIYEYNDFKKIKLLLSDYLILKLNKYSNYFKTSWLTGLVFILVVTFIFHCVLSISKSYDFENLKNYVSLINLTDFELLKNEQNTKFYVTVFFAKLSIGFGIYQLVQAFRKFK
ncbi:hypothetical protein [Mesohalobacter halotolerans]|uniref:Pentapeptide repeat-containing protein n=1 Tax=Mesohalobacter halotolerans TaxID=1883405 RepID=A0A4U5TQM0_9FLAO|nr:hypothetical protein [Mesohalobacter halotolerans]TKS56489.1 hypothetical protein FCN74_05480 [Mesohalobacter halotolerans]